MKVKFNQEINPRKILTPQMETYDNLGIKWHPYIMFFQKPNYKSRVVNTDKFGFRFNQVKNNRYSPFSDFKKSEEELSFIVGSSTVFGVGASNDSNTISSIISKETNDKFLNFGCRAHVSSQELILFSQISSRFKKIKNVIIFSGLNDLYISSLRGLESELSPFFFSNQFSERMNNGLISKKRKLLKYLLSPIYGDNIDYENIAYKDLFKNIFFYPKNQPSFFDTSNNSFDVLFTISQIKKNLYIWKKLSESYPFNLIFVLQPTLDWMSKPASKEEKQIFDYGDKYGDKLLIRDVLKKEIYKDYSVSLKNICESLEIRFFDANLDLKESFKKDDWIFVDRGGHMTDHGYASVGKYIKDILGNS